MEPAGSDLTKPISKIVPICPQKVKHIWEIGEFMLFESIPLVLRNKIKIIKSLM